MERNFLIIIPVIVIILLRLYPFSLCFRPLNTLIHEFSHAFIALILGDKVKEIKINNDFSGSCTTVSKNKFKQLLVSLSGYIIPAFLGYIIIRYLYSPINYYLLYILIVINLLALILYIRSSFGIVWTLCFTTFNILVVYLPLFSEYQTYILYIYACILLLENLSATLELLKTNISSSKKAGDSYNIQKNTHIPAIISTLFFLSFSVFMVYLSFIQISNRL
ncbi:MAG: M50 family metallopeptidase [Bacteroidales bacterium]|nr:M50 family metallopeptidase [Bacteroidales bacterium]